jgi:hypothetical protein
MTDSPFIDPLPADVAARAAEVKANRRATRLVYGSDLRPGMIVVKDLPCHLSQADRWRMILTGGSHEHGTAEYTILEVRTDRGHSAAILVGEDGEQTPFYCDDMELVRITV